MAAFVSAISTGRLDKKVYVRITKDGNNNTTGLSSLELLF